MKNFTERRFGIWYPKKFIIMHCYDADKKQYKNFEMSPEEPIVFVEDVNGPRECDSRHVLIIRMRRVLHPRVNQARWNKKFER